ncbi:septum formation family protein [Demequina sp. SYSU T00192]|uniref:Septum formation family protein n=1 Tax=Demequina litoralis TaxID=3051660 RepID=A0ABT8GA30_9MICO|nr:septum formation family protein [Demequina sp. SYSU T00192]MDN4475991.1 septum formation family protein [Demequina sp. SYSU T00192]
MRRPIVLAAVAVLLLAGCSDSERQELAVGDCLTISGTDGSFGNVPVVDCAGVHEAEVYAAFDLDAGAYDEDAVIVEVEEACVDRFEAYVGEPYRTSSLDVFYTYPLADAWDEGDRLAVCAVYAPDPDSGEPVAFEGTLADAA